MTLQDKASDYVSKHIPPNSAIYVTMKKEDIINIVYNAYVEAHTKVEQLEKELQKYKNENNKQKSANSGSMQKL